MPFTVDLQPGETCITNLSFVADKKQPFFIAIDDRALYLMRSKVFATRDPIYTQRVPLENVREVRIFRIHPLVMWTVAAVMIIVGGVTTWAMLQPLLHGEKAQVSGYPPAIAIVGAVIPFVTKRRYALKVTMVDGTYKWKPPIVVDKASRNATAAFLGEIANACRTARLNVVDEQEGLAEKKTTSLYPLAQAYEGVPVAGKVIRNCYHCSRPLLLGRWDDLNGFLVTCPHCGNPHGKSWNVPLRLFGSIFLNALGFFFTLRWKQALPLFIVFAAYAAFATRALDDGRWSQTSELIGMSIYFMGPVVVTAFLVLRHQSDLKRVAAFKASA